MPSPSSSASRTVGRPRSGGSAQEGRGRELILDAAARLFAESGYAATSTRQIAEAVGMRQGSLYYHFSSKEQILAELLQATVRPSLAFADSLEQAKLDPLVALHALMRFDVEILLSARWNVGMLYALPDVATPPLATFREEREALRAVYRRLVDLTEPAHPGPLLADLLLGLVESVIAMRRDVLVPTHAHAPECAAVAVVVADAGLRLLGIPAARAARTAITSSRLIGTTSRSVLVHVQRGPGT